jgi:hypothetical protein
MTMQKHDDQDVRLIIISVPPEPLYQALHTLQVLLSSDSDSREALRYPPHLTLRTGLVCPDEASTAAILAISDYICRLSSVEVRSAGPEASSYQDAAGNEHGFLGYRMELSTELLALHNGLLAYKPWQKGPQGTFEPHLSLCYHDITAATASLLLERHHHQIEAIAPSWEIRFVELWEPAGEFWRPRSQVRLLTRSAP